MKNLEEYYILGEPIDTDIGKCRFIKVREFPDVSQDLGIMTLGKDHIVNLLCKQSKEREHEIVEKMKDVSLHEIVFTFPDLKESYRNMFTKVFSDESFKQIDGGNFPFYRNLILKMNCQKEEKINPNPEIQRAIERSRRVKAQDGETLHFSDIVTSIVGFNGLTYDNINNFTLYQLYMTYYRIGQFKNYDTSTLFATVSPSKSKIDSWSKHIDMFAEEKHFVTQEEFNKNTGSAFKD